MTSCLHQLPQELFSEIARLSAQNRSGGLPSAPARLACVDKTFHNRLALSSIFHRPIALPFTPEGVIDPASLTHPRLWAEIFRDLFSSSAISRRSFTPSPKGYAIQLIHYCRLLRWLRHSSTSPLTFEDDDKDPYQNQCLEIMFLMLLECDGKNTCQLDWAGGYDYCKRWISIKMYPVEIVDSQTKQLANTWPRDDRSTAYALWNMWMLTTHDRLAAETSQDTIFIQDLLFRFCYCSWRYPHSYAPISRYTLPLETQNMDSQNSLGVINPHSSVAGVLPYPVFRSVTSSQPRFDTSPSCVPYFGSTLSWSPPLITNASKLLYHCRADSITLQYPPGILPANRAEFFIRRQESVQRTISANAVLGALYGLVQIHGLDGVYWMVQSHQLPPHVANLAGLDDAIAQIGGITGINGVNPSEAVLPTDVDLMAWNSHRETPFPFRGGWNEDGDDSHNKRWPKELNPDDDEDLPCPPRRRIDRSGLPYACTKVSAVHDSLFWRLKVCGDPSDTNKEHLFDFLHPEDIQNLALDNALRSRWNRLMPGKTWRPGLLDGLFQGSSFYPPEHWLLNSYRSNTFPVEPIGTGIAFKLSNHREFFIGRFQEHHLLTTAFGATTPNPIIPFTCDARTFPKNPPSQTPSPIAAFADSIDPGDEWVIDEGGMNAFLPAGFRYEQSTIDGIPVALCGWGIRGPPPPDRMTVYQTFMPDQPSTHTPSICTSCQERTEYLEYVEQKKVLQQRREEEQEEMRIESLWQQVGMASPVPLSVPEDHELSRRAYHSPTNVQPCDGILDILITGQTDLQHGQAWHHYNFLGRVRKWDGLVCILRIPKYIHSRLPTYLFYGNFESDLNFVGSWRHVTGDRILQANMATPPLYNPSEGLNGNGLFGRGGAGVLGDGMRVVHEGPFTMSKIVEE